jgi:hypothetical protein
LKSKLLAIICSLFTLVSLAQPKEITLTGTLEVNTGEIFPYKIVVTESGGVIKGYSLTYKEPNETKAVISGTLDRMGHTLKFKETEIVYSRGFHTKAFMCLIDARLRDEYGNSLIGPITSKEADNTACTGGKIIFKNSEQIQNLFGYHDQYDTIISMKKKPKPSIVVPEDPHEEEPSKVMVTEKVTAGMEKIYEWHSDTVVIDVWDGGNVDGDRITLKYNGNTYLDKYYLAKQKKQLRIPVSRVGTDIITILADNEGTEPPNTASLLLWDGSTKYSILAYNPKGNEAVIKIRRVK